MTAGNQESTTDVTSFGAVRLTLTNGGRMVPSKGV
jgi:hypothetical protein